MFGIGKEVGGAAGQIVKDSLGGVGKILDTLVTNIEERGRVDIEFNKLQTEINKLESQRASLFVSGWRPFIGWICGVGIGFNFIVRPVINYFLMVFYPAIPIMKSLEMGVLSTLVTGMLGFGAIRTYEKIKNKARN